MAGWPGAVLGLERPSSCSSIPVDAVTSLRKPTRSDSEEMTTKSSSTNRPR